MFHPDKYFLFSTLPDQPNVGIWLYNAQQEAAGQPVRLQADLVEWTAPRSILGGGPTTLGVGPYQYTTQREDEVYASNDPGSSREWFLIPANAPNTFLISLSARAELVWTVGEPQQPVTIQPFTGAPNQLFRFNPAGED